MQINLQRFPERIMVLMFFITFISLQSLSQTSSDSLRNLLLRSKQDTSRVLLLAELAKSYYDNNVDTTVLLAKEGIALAQKLKFARGEANCNIEVAEAFFIKGNMPEALDTYLKVLALREKIHDLKGMVLAYNSLSYLYNYSGKTNLGLSYGWLAFNVLNKDLKDEELLSKTHLNLGQSYLRMQKKDSALEYINKAYALAQRNNDRQMVGESLRILGFYYVQNGEKDLALEYYRRALANFELVRNQRDVAWTYFSMTTLFRSNGQIDSAMVYTERSLDICKKTNNPWGLEANYLILSRLYEEKDNSKAFAYFKLATRIKDSLFNSEKALNFNELTLAETLRQHEIENTRLQAMEDRRQNLQYAGIVMGLVVLIIIFLLYSHSTLANERLIKFFGVLALLISFELINLLIHPVLERITHHSTVLMLGIMVSIAAILIPFHHLLEKWITHKLIEKNKKIRLAAARKTIAKLENI